MPGDTSIAWTTKTWNPIVGCSVVSPGCTNCYAMGMAARLELMMPQLERDGRPTHYTALTKKVNGNPVWTGRLNKAPERILLEPLRRAKPTTYFVNSMSDLFHESVPDAWIDQVFAVMALSPQHTFQVLTKRSKRMREYFSATRQGDVALEANDLFIGHKCTTRGASKVAMFKINVPGAKTFGTIVRFKSWPLPNVWLGVSCEDQKRADQRIPDLLATPAAIRFVSAEPLLGPINFMAVHPHIDALSGVQPVLNERREVEDMRFGSRLDWVISGGESGADRRNEKDVVAHILDIDRQCAETSVAHFVKQDAGSKPGRQGRIPDWLWARKQMPKVTS